MEDKKNEHWQRTRRLMFITLGIWAIFSYVIHWFGDSLNNSEFLGFPLGFYMAAQGSLAAFVVLLFWFAFMQNSIDKDCGVDEIESKGDDAGTEDS